MGAKINTALKYLIPLGLAGGAAVGTNEYLIPWYAKTLMEEIQSNKQSPSSVKSSLVPWYTKSISSEAKKYLPELIDQGYNLAMNKLPDMGSSIAAKYGVPVGALLAGYLLAKATS